MGYLIFGGAPLVFIFWYWLNYTIANEFAGIAAKKGYTERKYFWYCFFLGMVGYLIVIGLVPNGAVNSSSKSCYAEQPKKEEIPEI